MLGKITLRLQFLHEHLERHIPVRNAPSAVSRTDPSAAKNAGFPDKSVRKTSAVGEKSDQRFQFRAIAAGLAGSACPR